MRWRARALAAAAIGIAVLVVAGCGRDDFENEPRPAAPAEVGIKLGEDEVVVSPREVGAGLVNFTIANLGSAPGSVEISGPTEAASDEIAPGATTTLKTELQTGEYEAIANGPEAAPFEFVVGPDRESSSSELLLP
jgi:hypothetical protein